MNSIGKNSRLRARSTRIWPEFYKFPTNFYFISRHTVHCTIPNNCNMKGIVRRMNKTWTKYLAFPATTILSIMKSHRPISIAMMFQLCRACMRMSRPDAKHIMYATMDEKDIREHLSYAQTAPFLINKSSLAIGGTMLTADKHKTSISKQKCRKIEVSWIISIEWIHFVCFQFKRGPRTQSVLPKEEGRRFTRRQICDQCLN